MSSDRSMMNEEELEERVVDYWSKRAEGFGEVRKEELDNEIGLAWKAYVSGYLTKNVKKILDVGTGTGFFCFLLEPEGYDLTGIDLTPSMIAEANEIKADRGSRAEFMVMNAQELEFADETFDAIITRNLTWTLPDVRKAYREWHRVLKKGGMLLNFDANYKQGLGKETTTKVDLVYGHRGMTEEMKKENDAITRAMSIGEEIRPMWDKIVLEMTGFSTVSINTDVDDRFVKTCSGETAPLFVIHAIK